MLVSSSASPIPFICFLAAFFDDAFQFIGLVITEASGSAQESSLAFGLTIRTETMNVVCNPIQPIGWKGLKFFKDDFELAHCSFTVALILAFASVSAIPKRDDYSAFILMLPGAEFLARRRRIRSRIGLRRASFQGGEDA
jgi:hypothetical protein